MSGCQRWWGLGEMNEGVKRYKPSAIRKVSSGHVIYSIIGIVNNTVLYFSKLLRG